MLVSASRFHMNSNSKPDESALSIILEPGFLSRSLRAIVSKAASLAILAAIVLVAWVAFSFARISLAGDFEPAAASSAQLVPAAKPAEASAATNLGRRESLVYVTSGDERHYHQCGHNPTGAERQAITTGLARTRGLQPCPACFRP